MATAGNFFQTRGAANRADPQAGPPFTSWASFDGLPIAYLRSFAKRMRAEISMKRQR